MDKSLKRFYFITFIFVATLVLVFVPNHRMREQFTALSTCGRFEPTIDKSLGDKKAHAMFVFDDNWDTQYTEGFKILDKYKMKGSIAVVPTLVGDEGYMNFDELKEVYDEGWDLLNHTYTHPDLNTLTYREQKKEINKTKKWLDGRCFSRGSNIVIYPYGSYNATTLELLKKEGYKSARSLKTGYEDVEKQGIFELKVHNLLTDTEPEWIEAWIDEAIKKEKTIIFVMHKIEQKKHDEAQMIFQPDKLEHIAQYLMKHNDKINVVTYSEYLQLVDRATKK